MSHADQFAHLATGHHGYGCGVAVGVSEYATNVNLKTITNIQTAIIKWESSSIDINVKTSLTAAFTIGMEISGFPSPTSTRHPPDFVA